MKSQWFALILIIFSISGCSYFALFSPEVALDKYQRVGVVTFTSDSKGNLNEIITHGFLKEIRKASKKALIIELGNKDKLLESVNETEMNPAFINKIAKKYDLSAIIIGKTEVHDVNPLINVTRHDKGRDDIAGSISRDNRDNSSVFGHKSLRVKFEIDASLNVSLIEAKSLDTVWEDSAREKKTVIPTNTYPISKTQGVYFDKKDSEETHKGLTNALVQDIIHKLRTK